MPALDTRVVALKAWGKMFPEMDKMADEVIEETRKQLGGHKSIFEFNKKITDCITYSKSARGQKYWSNVSAKNVNFGKFFPYEVKHTMKVGKYSLKDHVEFSIDGEQCSIEIEHFMVIKGLNCVYGTLTYKGSKNAKRLTRIAVPFDVLITYQHDAKYRGSKRPKLAFKPVD